MTSQVENQTSLARPEVAPASMQRRQKLLAAGGVLGALAASSCCIVPLALFGLGVSGAWIGNLTRLAPYQPYFIAATAACLGGGYWLLYRSRKVACADGEVCARPVPNRVVKIGLILATVLVIVRWHSTSSRRFSSDSEGEHHMRKFLSAALFGLSLLASSATFAGEKTVTLAVQNMSCSACPITVKSSLDAVPGVAKVVVSLSDKTAVVTFDDAKTAVPALITATTNAGYPSALKS